MDEFDHLIIGAGQAAIPLARSLRKAGHRVALAERKHLGGSCVNFGCTPTKAVLASARVAHQARRAGDFGIRTGEVSVDFQAVLKRARALVEESKQSLRKTIERNDITLLDGHAKFRGRDGKAFVVAVNKRVVKAHQVVIDTGARTSVPPVPGLADIDYLDAGNWLARDTLPREMLVVGAGYIGLEMGQFYRRMGCRVTLVHPHSHVASREDEDVAKALQAQLEREGVRLRLNARLSAARVRQGGSSVLTVESAQGPEDVTADGVFLATGRRANTDDLGLETIGLAPADKGVLEVDERLSTRIEGVWAAGDVRGGPMFTHTSWDDHRILESQLIGDRSRTTRGRVVPYAIFTDPELGRVGITEREARDAIGEHAKVLRFDLASSGRAREAGETNGLIKLVIDARTDELLGAAVLAAEGGEMVASYITLMNARAPLDVIRRAIYIHPTFSEAIQSAAG